VGAKEQPLSSLQQLADPLWSRVGGGCHLMGGDMVGAGIMAGAGMMGGAGAPGAGLSLMFLALLILVGIVASARS
jgi:hypothetical protein